MNIRQLPFGSNEPLPATIDGQRSLAQPYRSIGTAEVENTENSIRAALLKYLGLAIKHKYLIAAICFVALFCGFVATFMTTKIYSGSTTVKIDRAVPKLVNNQSSQFEGVNDPQFYQTQYELIRSRMLAERVATALNLAQTDFVGGRKASLLDRLLGRGAAQRNVVRDAAAIRSRHEQAIGQIMGGLSVQPVALSSLVRIRFSSPSPVWAQRISIAMAEQYEKSVFDMRYAASSHARSFLDERLQQVKVKLQDSETELLKYAQKQGIVDVDNKQPQIMMQIHGIQTAYSDAVSTRVKLEQLWQQADSDGGAALPQVMSDNLIQSARAKLSQLRANYQDKLTVMKPAFPEMIAIQTQVRETEKDIRNQVNLIKNSIKAQYEAALSQEKALGEKLEQLNAEALEARVHGVEYTILLREVDTARSLYDGLLQQVKQQSVIGDIDTNNVSIIDRAMLPYVPDSPSLGKNLMMALLLGLGAAAAAITITEVLDDTFKTPEDIEEKLGLSVLGITPRFFDPKSERTALNEVISDPTSPLAEAYRSLRTAVQFSTADGAPRTLLVTSSRPGEGKSTTAACLALNFAQLGMRVLLIDADMRNPSLHRVLSLDNSSGLSNYLSGAAEASTLVKNCIMSGVTVMTTGPLPPNPAELLASPRLGTLLSTASESFQVVIIDGPPVMGLADAPIIASIAEGTMLVIEGAKTRRALARDALKRLEFARARVVGALLNKFDPKRAGVSYGYGNYGYGYGYGYGQGAERYVYGQKEKPVLSNNQNAA